MQPENAGLSEYDVLRSLMQDFVEERDETIVPSSISLDVVLGKTPVILVSPSVRTISYMPGYEESASELQRRINDEFGKRKYSLGMFEPLGNNSAAMAASA